jgi:hypothetical protein
MPLPTGTNILVLAQLARVKAPHYSIYLVNLFVTERIVTIEDAIELQLRNGHVVP